MFPNNNPNLVEKLVHIRQEEILQEVQNERKLPRFRARLEILIMLILIAVFLWFFL
jgi:hypothetical protein